MARVFGMIPSGTDKRDYQFSSSADVKSIPDEYEIPNIPDVMNQGSDPICAALCIASIMEWQSMARDKENRGKVYDAYQIYNLREDKKMQGMIPRQALKAVKKVGVNGDYINAFARVGAMDTAKMAILCNGPLMIGTEAYDDPVEFWKPKGELLGGHAVILVGWDKDGFTLQNSWGYEYGNRGRVTFPYEDWNKILEAWTVII